MVPTEATRCQARHPLTSSLPASACRVRGGAPDAGECERRLRSRIDEMFAVCAIVLVARPQSVVELNVLQLDTLEPLTMEWSAERGVFMLQEMQLTKQQVGGERGCAAACVAEARRGCGGSRRRPLPTRSRVQRQVAGDVRRLRRVCPTASMRREGRDVVHLRPRASATSTLWHNRARRLWP